MPFGPYLMFNADFTSVMSALSRLLQCEIWMLSGGLVAGAACWSVGMMSLIMTVAQDNEYGQNHNTIATSHERSRRLRAQLDPAGDLSDQLLLSLLHVDFDLAPTH